LTRIDQQRDLIAKLERDGHAQALADARWRLAMMEQTLARMEAEAAAYESPGLSDR
jgi:BMFP domain-containing protein YqiC